MENKMKVEVWVTYVFGGNELYFTKEFDMPFAPFFGMVLFEEDDEHENDICFDNNDTVTTTILWYPDKSKFVVDVRNRWKQPVREDVVDNIFETHKIFNWYTDETEETIKKLKDLMTSIANKDK